MPDRILTAVEVAQLLRIAQADVEAWVRKGWLARSRGGNGPALISEDALERFLLPRGLDLRTILSGGARPADRLARNLQEYGRYEAVSTKQARHEASGPPAAVPDSVARVAGEILRSAVRSGATHIHLRFCGGRLALSLRIGGRLREKPRFADRLPPPLGPQVVAHFKDLAGLGGSGVRVGSFRGAVDGREVRFRLAASPAENGELLVIAVPSARDY